MKDTVSLWGRRPSWITYISQRIQKNKNFLSFISGATGSGKSWASLSIAEQLDPEFSIDRVVFSGHELMDTINSGKLHAGSVIVFEEAGIGLSSRNWQSVTNKMLNYLLQTFRHRNFVLIFNSPYMDFVDASTRRLFHAEFQTSGINFQEGTTRLKPHLIQYNSRMQKFYYKRLRVRTTEGFIPVNFWHVKKPSDVLIEAYEKKKRAFTDRLNKEIYEELDALSGSKKKELTEHQQDVLNLLREGKTLKDIAKVQGIALRNVYGVIKQIKKKDIDIKPIRENGIVVKYEVCL